MRLAETLIPQDLAYFALLYEHRSYSAAAKAVPMSYQGFKKALRLLEKDLGVTLFAEHPQAGLTPTPYADALYRMTQRWQEDVSALEKTYEALLTQVSTYRLVAVNGTLNHLGADIVREFHKRHPAHTLDIEEYPDAHVDEMLASGACDTAITAAPYADGFANHPLFSSTLCFWVNDAHPLAQRERINLTDLEGECISLPDAHYKLSARFTQLLNEVGVTPREISYDNNILAPYAYALSNRGLGLSVQDAEAMFGARPEVHPIPVEGMAYELAFSHRRDYEPTEDDRLVLDFLTSLARPAR